MIKKVRFFKIIDIFIGIITIICIISITHNWVNDTDDSIKYIDILIIIIVALVINTIKALRLYIALFGESMNNFQFVKYFLKTSCVNIALPYKSGELYRVFLFGNFIKSYTKSFTIVILDRFVDTLGLTTVALFQIMLHFSTKASLKIYAWLALFLGMVILAYCLFVPFYKYWNKFLIFNKSSERTLIGLKILNICYRAYLNANKIIRGRFVILYILSLVAWGIETWSIHRFLENWSFDLSNYLSNILTSKVNNYNIMYILCSSFVFCIVGIIVILLGKWKGEKNDG